MSHSTVTTKDTQSVTKLAVRKQYRLAELIETNPKPHRMARIFGVPANLEDIRADVIANGVRDCLTAIVSRDEYLIADGVQRLFAICIPYHADNPSWDPDITVEEYSLEELQKADKSVATLIVGKDSRNLHRRQLTKGQRAYAAAELFVELETDPDNELLNELLNLARPGIRWDEVSGDKRDVAAAPFRLSGSGIQPVITVLKKARDNESSKKRPYTNSREHMLLEALCLDYIPPYKLNRYRDQPDKPAVARALGAARKKKTLEDAANEFCQRLDAALDKSAPPAGPIYIKDSAGKFVPEALTPAFVEGRRLAALVEPFAKKLRAQISEHPCKSDIYELISNFEEQLQRFIPSFPCSQCWDRDPEGKSRRVNNKKSCSECNGDGFVSIAPLQQARHAQIDVSDTTAAKQKTRVKQTVTKAG